MRGIASRCGMESYHKSVPGHLTSTKLQDSRRGRVRDRTRDALCRYSVCKYRSPIGGFCVIHMRGLYREMTHQALKLLALAMTFVVPLLWISASATCGEDGGSLVAGDEFSRRLDRITGIFWADVPLRDGLLRLGRANGVAVVVDRRCDPEREVTLTIRDRPLREVVSAIAQSCGWEAVFVSPLIYVGPAESAQRLESIMALRRQEALKCGKVGLAGLHPRAVSWPRLSTPRQLITLWLQEANWQLTNPDAILHDLWPEATLPPMTLVDRLTLVLMQFDQTFELSESGEVRIVPMTDPVGLAKRFAVGPRARILAQQWQQMFPDCQVSVVGNDVVVQGPREALDKLSELLNTQKGVASSQSSQGHENPSASGSAPSDPFEQRRFTVREGRGTLEGVIRQLAQQLGMQIDFDRETAIQAGIRLDQPIRFQVQNGTIDQLWHAVLDPHGLAFERTGQSIRIYPKR